MEKRTLQFQTLIDVARFSKMVSCGYLINTNKLTLTGKFSDQEVAAAEQQFQAKPVETTELVYAYR